MKNGIKILVVTTAIMLVSCASEFKIMSTDVPEPVMKAFQAKYPNMQNVEWEAEKADGHLTFEAAYKVDGKEREAIFKPDGTFIKEE
jgi:hypothetical protein